MPIIKIISFNLFEVYFMKPECSAIKLLFCVICSCVQSTKLGEHPLSVVNA